jgi:hypothetical protein
MLQQIHADMAESVKHTYIQCRPSNEDDLINIMMAVADDLTLQWKKYDADSFVNAWDVSNYVSDYLTAKSGIEGCECSSKIY